MEKNTSVGGMMLRLPGWAGSAAMKTAVMCLAEALIAALLSRGVILGAYAPLGAAWAASVAAVTPERQRIRSYASLMGAVLGYCVAAQVDGLRYAAAAVLAAAVVMVLREVKHVLFLPAAVVISFLATGAVYAFTGAPTAGKMVLFFCEAIAAGGAAYFYGICRRQLPGAGNGALSREDSGRVGGKLGQWELYREVTPPSAMVRAAWAVAAASVAACLGLHAPLWGIRLGCLFALICVLACVQAGAAHSACAGLLLGAALDLCAGEILPRGYINAGLTSNGAVFAAVYGFLGLFAGIYRRKGPFIVSLAFVLGNAAALPWLWKGTAAPLFEGFAASVLYLCFSRPLRDLTAQLFPRRGVRIDPGTAPPGEDIGGANLAPVLQLRTHGREADTEYDALEERLDALRAAFSALKDAVIPQEYPSQPASENPGAVFTFAAERSCRSCSMRDQCWNREYSGTRSAFNDASPAILRRGSALVTDFPPYFAARCLRLPELVACINDTLAAMRYRQRFHRRVREDNRLLCAQYDGMAAVLDELMSSGVRASCAASHEQFRAIVGAAMHQKEGEAVCGDAGRYFKTRDGRLFILISDGMGSGVRAGEQSAALAHLLQSFLQAGVSPETVLRLVCPAFALRSGGDCVASIDLFELNLCTCEGIFCKCGAASSWLLRPGAEPRRIGAGTIPAGVTLSELAEAERIRLRLQPGDRVVMVSDGVENPKLASCVEKSPGELAEGILQAAMAGGCGDDMTVMVCAVMENEK